MVTMFGQVKVLLYLLMLFSLKAVHTVNPANVYNKFLIPGLPSNYEVVNLNHVTKTLFRFSGTTTHRLTALYFNNDTFSQNLQAGIQTTLLSCTGSSQKVQLLGFFCIDETTWAIKTMDRYSSELKSRDQFVLSFKSTGVKENGNVTAVFYELRIIVNERCATQKRVYDYLITSRPFITTLDTFIITDGIEFSIPDNTKGLSLAINSVMFYRFTSFKGKLQILDGNNTLIYNQAVKITSSTTTVVIQGKLPTGVSKVVLKLLEDGNGFFRMPRRSTISLQYYSLNDLCSNEDGLLRYYYWKWLTSGIPSNEKSCVKDLSLLTNAYVHCTSPSPSIKMYGAPPAYGKPLTLECSFDTLLPHTVTWQWAKGDLKRHLPSSNRWYNISSLGFVNDAYYRCIVSTLFKTYIVRTEYFRIQLQDVFSGLLILRLSDLVYDPAFGDISSQSSLTLKAKIQSNVLTLFTGRNESEYDIFKFRNSRGKVLVSGHFNVRKISSQSTSMSYVHWVTSVHQLLESRKVRLANSRVGDIELLTSEVCMTSKTTTQNRRYTYKWPPAVPGQTVSLPCHASTTTFTTRKCVLEKPNYASWTLQNDSQCQDPQVVRELVDILQTNITKDNAESVSMSLEDASSHARSPYDITLVAANLDRFVSFMARDNRIDKHLMKTVDNVLNMNEQVLSESEQSNSSTSKILSFCGKVGEKLASDKPYTIKQRNFALGSVQLNQRTYKGLSIEAKTSNMFIQLNFKTDQPSNTSLASIQLPETLFTVLSTNPLKRFSIISLAFEKDRLFPRDKLARQTNDKKVITDEHWKVNTFVISTEVRGEEIKNLTKPIVLKFKAFDRTNLEAEKICAYWDARRRAWSSDGCILAASDKIAKTYTCHCNHLTNFAILFNATPTSSGTHGKILTLITYIGLSISLLGALITLLTHLIFPMLRETTPPKILMNLCLALSLMIIIFLVGVERRTSQTGCKIISILLQYLFLCVFSWSAVEGFHSARSLAFPMKVEITMFIQKCCLFGWGTPVIFTAIGAGVWYDNYGGDDSCVVRGKAFFVTILAPILATILFNMTSLIAIMMSLKTSKEYSTNALSAKDRLRIVVAFVVLFGITWTFGILVISNDQLALQYIFCILCSFQGLYIFLFYCIRNQKIRRLWHGLLQGKKISELRRLSTFKHTSKARAGTVDSMTFNSTTDKSFASIAAPVTRQVDTNKNVRT